MILIQSNIGEAIGRLERLYHGLPGALQRAVAPVFWSQRLKLTAGLTLRAQWAQEKNPALKEFYERMTPLIVDTMVSEVFPEAVSYRLGIPERAGPTGVDIEGAAETNLERRTPTGRIKKEVVNQGIFDPATLDRAGEENVQRVRQVILDWVMMEKEWGPGDRKADGSPMDPEELAERIGIILGVSAGAAPRGRTPAMEEAAGRLAKAIEGWLAGEGNTPPPDYGTGSEPPPWRSPSGGTNAVVLAGQRFDPKVAKQWMEAVMAAWKALVLSMLPGRVEAEIRKLMKV